MRLSITAKKYFLCRLLKDMENSILDQIIDKQKAEEVARLNAIEIVNNLFNELAERERNVLIRRYGLHGKDKETLEKVGKAHELTRERIRQIEASSIKKLLSLSKLSDYVSDFKKVINQLLEEHGGFMDKDYLLELLVIFSADGIKKDKEVLDIHKSHLNFLISKLLKNDFELTANSKHFNNSYKLKYKAFDHIEELAEELHEKIKEINNIFKTEELISVIKNLDKYKAHKDKFDFIGSLDVSDVLGGEYYKENSDIINENKALYTILRAAKKINQNKFGYWGHHKSKEIKPKTINDKIYLILKHMGDKPLHFIEIAQKINEIGFDNKKANPATVHNELILDDKYVLVGRGLYTLKEKGFKKGTVSDVIKEVLANNNPMKRDEIIEKVLEKRMVKKATIVLALMDREKFKFENSLYSLNNN
jgi:hypothetical protein